MYYVFDWKVYSATVDVKVTFLLSNNTIPIDTTVFLFKILCSQQPEKLQWIPAKPGDKISDFKDIKLVLGGHAVNPTQLIGRIRLEDGLLAMGKILVIDGLFTKIFVRNYGRVVSNSGPYRVLVYNQTSSEIKQKSGCDSEVSKIHLSCLIWLSFILVRL